MLVNAGTFIGIEFGDLEGFSEALGRPNRRPMRSAISDRPLARSSIWPLIQATVLMRGCVVGHKNVPTKPTTFPDSGIKSNTALVPYQDAVVVLDAVLFCVWSDVDAQNSFGAS